MPKVSEVRIGFTVAAALIGLLGLVGHDDYIAQREAECAGYVKHYVYDEQADVCLPVRDHQPPTDGEYYAAPEKSRPEHN